MKTRSLVEGLFRSRSRWEPVWDIAYRYIVPERAPIVRTSDDGAPQDEVFDSTAIDAAEKLVNLLVSGMIPAWGRWFRLTPGAALSSPDDAAAVRPALRMAEDAILSALSASNFYQEAQPALLDRVVGGTGAIEISTHPELSVQCVPLGELAIAEDSSGRIYLVVRSIRHDIASILRLYNDKIPQYLKEKWADKQPTDTEQVFVVSMRTVEGTWEYRKVLDSSPEIELERSFTRWPRLIATRWSKVPGTPYGRGPGLRALSDTRALNKLKELSLKNAALATSGVYTVVNDGVLNPHTMVVEPGALIPVASNSPNEPSVLPLKPAADFNVAHFSMDELRNSIKSTFMADQFQPLGRTPLSATEVAERTRVIASDMGASLARLQNEMLIPLLNFVADYLKGLGRLPEGLDFDGSIVGVQFVSRMAQAQWQEDFQSIVDVMAIAGQVGQFDPRAALVIDGEASIRELAQLRGMKPELMRGKDEIDGMMQQAQQAREQGMVPGMEEGNELE